MDKQSVISQWILNILVIMIVAAYGFIFNSVSGRISKNEVKIGAIDPVLLQIQTDLSQIKTDLSWLIKANDISKK